MRLALRQTQRLVMTPLLQQAIQLLQLSTLELKEVVEQELNENPLLEEVTPDNSPDAPQEEQVAEQMEPMTAPGVTEPVSKETSTVEEERASDLPFDLTSAMWDQHDERTPVSTEEREEMPFENLGSRETSLTEHLTEQLRHATDDETIIGIGESIIGNLDDDGYLRAEVGEIAGLVGQPAEDVAEGARAGAGLRSHRRGRAQHPGVPAAPDPRRSRCPTR